MVWWVYLYLWPDNGNIRFSVKVVFIVFIYRGFWLYFLFGVTGHVWVTVCVKTILTRNNTDLSLSFTFSPSVRHAMTSWDRWTSPWIRYRWVFGFRWESCAFFELNAFWFCRTHSGPRCHWYRHVNRNARTLIRVFHAGVCSFGNTAYHIYGLSLLLFYYKYNTHKLASRDVSLNVPLINIQYEAATGNKVFVFIVFLSLRQKILTHRDHTRSRIFCFILEG